MSKLDEVYLAALERRRQQQAEAVTRPASEVSAHKEQEASDAARQSDGGLAPYIPELPAPDDWFIRGVIAKAKREGVDLTPAPTHIDPDTLGDYD